MKLTREQLFKALERYLMDDYIKRDISGIPLYERWVLHVPEEIEFDLELPPRNLEEEGME